jgi:hypothetical protein
MSKLDDAVQTIRETLDCDRSDALRYIARKVDKDGAFQFAKTFEVLDSNNSAEEFMLEFMETYNNEIERRY